MERGSAIEIRLRAVGEGELCDYVERLNRIGNATAGTTEEFQHYYNSPINKFFEVIVDNSSLVIGAICVIFNGTRSIASGFALDESGDVVSVRCKLTLEDINKIGIASCVNYPRDIVIPDLKSGKILWNFYEYYIKSDDITKYVTSGFHSDYKVQNLKNAGSISSILEFDRKLFSLEDREDFIETCAIRSDVIYAVTKNGEVTGFGMLSKPIAEKRLFGPVYCTDIETTNVLTHFIFSSVLTEHPASEIIAYVPEDSIGYRALRRKGFETRRPLKIWVRYSSLLNYELQRKYIVGMGSLLFDIC